MKHFFFFFFLKKIVFMCVSKRDEGFQCHALRRTQQRYLGFFFCLLQTFLINIMSGVERGVIFAWALFCYQRNKSCGWKTFVCAGCRKQTLKFNTSCCYLFGKNHVGCLYFTDVGFSITDCNIMWCDRASLILFDNIKRWNDNQKHYCGQVWYVCMLRYSEAPRHT